jgi:hypothetical protein
MALWGAGSLDSNPNRGPFNGPDIDCISAPDSEVLAAEEILEFHRYHPQTVQNNRKWQRRLSGRC